MPYVNVQSKVVIKKGGKPTALTVGKNPHDVTKKQLDEIVDRKLGVEHKGDTQSDKEAEAKAKAEAEEKRKEEEAKAKAKAEAEAEEKRKEEEAKAKAKAEKEAADAKAKEDAEKKAAENGGNNQDDKG